jgi:hypothetical protein
LISTGGNRQSTAQDSKVFASFFKKKCFFVFLKKGTKKLLRMGLWRGLRRCGGWLLGGGLRVLLLFGGLVVADCAAGGGAEHGVVPRDVTGDPAHGGARRATGVRRERRAGDEKREGGGSIGRHGHS